MKNSFLAFFIFIIFSSTLFAKQDMEYDFEKLKLNGQVLSLRQISYDVVIESGEVSKGNLLPKPKNTTDLHKNIFIGYDRSGNVSEWIHYKQDGSSVYRKINYQYDANNWVIEGIVFQYSESKTFNSRYNYTYDKNGNLLEKKVEELIENYTTKRTHKYNSRGLPIKGEYINVGGSLQSAYTKKYDKWGNLIEEKTYSGKFDFSKKNNKKLSNTKTFKFDKNQNLIESGYIIGDKKSGSYTTYTYDENGNMIESRYYAVGDQEPENYSTYKYDENGNEIASQRSNKTGLFSKKTTKNDNRGNKLEVHTYYFQNNMKDYHIKIKYNSDNKFLETLRFKKDGTVEQKSTYIYDEMGNTISIINQFSGGEPISHMAKEYTYDEQNNWIIQVHYSKGTPVYIIEREIKYY